MVADVYKTSRFYRACRLLANWRRILTEKSKREREKEKERERKKETEERVCVCVCERDEEK